MESISDKKKNKHKILKERKKNSKIALVFFAILVIFFVITIFAPNKKQSPYSREKVKKQHNISIKNLLNGTNELEFEEHIDKDFPLNNFFKRLNTATKILGQNEKNGVYNCKDDYLIENFDRPDVGLMDSQIAAMNKFFNHYKDLTMTLVVAPTKAEILDDKLPIGAYTKSQDEYINKFAKSLPKIKTINLISTLKSHRDEDIFYKTDSNWTSLGSYYSYKAVAAKIGLDTSDDKFRSYAVSTDYKGNLSKQTGFNQSVSDNIFVYLNSHSEFETLLTYSNGSKKTSIYDTNALNEDEKLNVFFGKNDKLVKIDTTSMDTRRLLVIGDSYMKPFVPFMLEHYETTYMVDPELYKGSVDKLMKDKKITDVMILYSANNLEKDKNIIRVLDYN